MPRPWRMQGVAQRKDQSAGGQRDRIGLRRDPAEIDPRIVHLAHVAEVGVAQRNVAAPQGGVSKLFGAAAGRSWSSIVGWSPEKASIGKNTPSVSRSGANIFWKPLESLGLAVRFGVSMSAMISPRALNRSYDIDILQPVQARAEPNGCTIAVRPAPAPARLAATAPARACWSSPPVRAWGRSAAVTWRSACRRVADRARRARQLRLPLLQPRHLLQLERARLRLSSRASCAATRISTRTRNCVARS